MPVLDEMPGADVSKLILSLDVMDTDYFFLGLFLYEEEPQANVLYSRAVGLVAGDVLISLRLTRCVTVVSSSVARAIRSMCESTATTTVAAVT